MQTNIRTGAENASVTNQLYTVAAIGALLFVVVTLAAMPFTDWNNPAATNTAIIVLGVVGYVALLPVILAVYQHLRPASALLSGIAVVAGVLALIGAASGTVLGFDSTPGMVGGMFASFGMLLFFGLSGYLALTSKLLPSGWAFLSILLGILAVAAGIISGAAGSNSPITGIAWTVFTLVNLAWSIWTAMVFMRLARTASTAA
jgi:hypothetical protein